MVTRSGTPPTPANLPEWSIPPPDPGPAEALTTLSDAWRDAFAGSRAVNLTRRDDEKFPPQDRFDAFVVW
jgi:hypothetical protein